MERKRMLIGGEWVEARSGRYYDNINPATEEVINQVPAAGPEDVDLAVAAAQKAYEESWGPMHPEDRQALLLKLADRIEERADELAVMESTDMGKPISQSRTGDVPGAAAFFRYFATLADKLEGETLITPKDTFGYTLREPYGVVAAIVPWNFPICMCGIKGGPALAAGNCVIFKPASPSPSTALEIGRMAQEVGFPPGVIPGHHRAGVFCRSSPCKPPRSGKGEFHGEHGGGAQDHRGLRQQHRQGDLGVGR